MTEQQRFVSRPPKVAEWLLSLLLPNGVRDAALGDLEEAHAALARSIGKSAADNWYWSQVLRSLNPKALWPSLRSPSVKTNQLSSGQRGPGDIMHSILQDIRYGLRSATKHIGFTAVVMLTLGLGVGANTAIFSVVDGILLRRLPYPEPEKLVTVWADYTRRDGPLREWLSYPNFHDLRLQDEIFEEVSAWSGFNPTLTGMGAATVVTGAFVSQGMFSKVLSIPPMIGRSFVPADDVPDAPNTILVSYGFWAREFGSDPEVVGRSLSLNGVEYTVIGVMPRGFRPPFVPNADLWGTFQLDPVAQQERRGDASFRVFARLRRGVPFETAMAGTTALGARLEQQYPEANTGVGYALFPLRADLTRSTQAPLWVLLGAVGFVLLIACVNVASLLLARMNARQEELALRAALGAGRQRIVRQLLTENAVFAFGGGVLGIALAVFGTRLLVSMAPSGTPRIEDVAVDIRVLLFAGGISAISTFVFGLLPALRGGRTDLVDALRVGGRGGDASKQSRLIGNVLVVSQVALALILLVGSGLMIRSMRALNAVDLGFEPQGLLTITLNLPQARYPDRAASYAFYSDLETRLVALPGVGAVGSTNTVPLAGRDGDVTFLIEGRALPRPGEEHALWIRRVTPTYFETIGTRMVRGRGFTPNDDMESPRVLIINQTLAERFFPNEGAVGKRINVNSSENPVWREIVGVAEDIKNFGIQGDSRFVGYFPFAQLPTTFMSMLIRTSGDPIVLISSARAVIAEMDPSLAASNISTMDTFVQDSLGQERFVTMLLTLFAVVALVLASVGLYGVVAYGVSRRVHEMGIRLALGAAGKDIRRLIVGKSMRVVLLGVFVGVVGGLFLTRAMSGLLFGVATSDPITFGLTALILTVVAFVASAIPAQRAVKIAPMAVLKEE